ncbi:hypothetical protein C3747_80g95 [Trypanosoma cruzi]|uniref:EF-hand domain-containing protein n=2 Tax=Trypanosoma cruzi TaxID=5693 RepID=Q4DA64_TRYCC|nr:hypothetical protein Tc00.1047053511131.40 [Trypanosoma cruzi]EAN89412.1 hypothetical protein Tc00.1047053511131.40 [Trypanosoma cruzi]PWV09360.1 hypothetical protein C3747_80g95 [Trypanosoma cruzi]RNC58594.1 hypothetical protein TcCL_ESM03758 [Trypanosoma cruzi]|eukprot:XP_811263.1 hypothetical protein [Trypanosoma cruzi strain CL Brener]
MSVPKAALMQIFDLYDTDRAGWIPTKRIPYVLRTCGMISTQTEMETLLHDHFASRDTVTRSGFQKFLEQKDILKAEDFSSEKELATAFQVFDSRESGALTSDEVLTILTRMNEKIDVDAYHRVMDGLELNEQGMVEFAKLAAHMLRSANEYKLTVRQVLEELAE